MEEKYTPELTLEGIAVEPQIMPVDTSTKAVEKSVQESVNLTPEEQRMVDEFSEKIDITDSSLVMNYGAKSQSKLSEFTDSALVVYVNDGRAIAFDSFLRDRLEIGRAHV